MFSIVLIAILVLLIVILAVLEFSYSAPIEVRKSALYGRSMFALRSFQKGQTIEVAPLIRINRPRDLAPESILKKYDIAFGGEHAIMLGYASIYNHSDDNNASWDFDFTDGDNIVISATKFIHNGDEIFVSYGPHYWGDRDDKI